MTNKVVWFSASDTRVGLSRKDNQDAVLDYPSMPIWAVADGVGGRSQGEIASREVVEALARLSPVSDIGLAGAETHAALSEANHRLRQRARALGSGSLVATTVVTVRAVRDWAVCLWAGSSRLYLLRGRELFQLTRDHVLAKETGVSGRSRYLLTQAVGARETLDPAAVIFRVLPDDILLLCSNGLTNTLNDGQIADLLEWDPHLSLRRLLDCATVHGARDDLSAVVVRAELVEGGEPL